ncbi:XRE family transcriptional regulator [Achromobacter animicus]|uniref:helix-turn-helix domain-containing protein n=1 Tax=Achromobacter animicus TaxID=1389935 RepID=UPI0028A77729|nr:XRE family transcriptional regulator [Achromobacter animicus]
MEQPNATAATADPGLDLRLAARLKTLRQDRGWSLDDLAGRAGISRATLSRLENGEVSPTANVLGKLCAAHGMTMSRLMLMVEDDFAAHVPETAQAVWVDDSVGFRRRSVSPPSQRLAGEVLACELAADARIRYDQSPRPGLEHHLLMLDGELSVTADGHTHRLLPGDCLRYQLFGASAFVTPPHSGARYLLFIV